MHVLLHKQGRLWASEFQNTGKSESPWRTGVIDSKPKRPANTTLKITLYPMMEKLFEM